MVALRRLLALGLVGLVALVVGTSTAPARTHAGPPALSGYFFQVTAWKSSSTETFSWSVENEANNSGPASLKGGGSHHETLKHHPLMRNGLAGDGSVMFVGYEVEGAITFPMLASYESHSVLKEAQHPPVHCRGSAHNRIGGSGLELASKGHAIVITWNVDTGGDCLPNVKEAAKNFTTTIAAGELKRPVVHLRGHGTVSLALESSIAGNIGYKSEGSLHWQATITMKRAK